MTFGYSRNDVATFLPEYLRLGILQDDPFATIDVRGVGALVERCVSDARDAARARKASLKIRCVPCSLSCHRLPRFQHLTRVLFRLTGEHYYWFLESPSACAANTVATLGASLFSTISRREARRSTTCRVRRFASSLRESPPRRRRAGR